MRRTIPILAALALLAAGCGNPRVPAGASDAYAEGWGAGCDSGYADAGRQTHTGAYRKDTARYEAGGDYARGWDEGYAHCEEEERRMPWVGGPAAIQM